MNFQQMSKGIQIDCSIEYVMPKFGNIMDIFKISRKILSHQKKNMFYIYTYHLSLLKYLFFISSSVIYQS